MADEADTIPPPSGTPTDPELPFYDCPECEGDGLAVVMCRLCSGIGVIDKQTMAEWKQQREGDA